jgi:hypothetical protein
MKNDGSSDLGSINLASAAAYRPSLSVTTRTAHGWTATSPQIRMLSC